MGRLIFQFDPQTNIIIPFRKRTNTEQRDFAEIVSERARNFLGNGGEIEVSLEAQKINITIKSKRQAEIDRYVRLGSDIVSPRFARGDFEKIPDVTHLNPEDLYAMLEKDSKATDRFHNMVVKDIQALTPAEKRVFGLRFGKNEVREHERSTKISAKKVTKTNKGTSKGRGARLSKKVPS